MVNVLGGIDGVKVGIKRKTLNLGRTTVASFESLCDIGRQRLIFVDPCFRNTGECVFTALEIMKVSAECYQYDLVRRHIFGQTDDFPDSADGAVEVSAMRTVRVFAVADEPDVLR